MGPSKRSPGLTGAPAQAVSTLIHLSANHAEYTCFAPDKDQMHVINHTSGEEMKETRNVLVESARISRGQVEVGAAARPATPRPGPHTQSVFRSWAP